MGENYSNSKTLIDKGFNFRDTKSNRILPVRKVVFWNGMMAKLENMIILIKAVEITFMSEWFQVENETNG